MVEFDPWWHCAALPIAPFNINTVSTVLLTAIAACFAGFALTRVVQFSVPLEVCCGCTAACCAAQTLIRARLFMPRLDGVAAMFARGGLGSGGAGGCDMPYAPPPSFHVEEYSCDPPGLCRSASSCWCLATLRGPSSGPCHSS
jgi:hypothetical protein